VLDGLERREERLVALVAERDRPPGLVEEVGVALVASDRPAEHGGAVGGVAGEHGRAPAAEPDGREFADRKVGAGERVAHGRQHRASTGSAEREMHEGARDPADREPADRVDRQVRAHVDARDRDEGDGRPQQPAGPPGEEGRRRGGESGGYRYGGRGEAEAAGLDPAQLDPLEQPGGRAPFHDPLDELGRPPRERRCHHEVARQSQPPERQREQGPGDRRDESRPQHHPERVLQEPGEGVDRLEQVGLGEADASVPHRQRRQHGQHHAEDDADDVTRVPFGSVGRRRSRQASYSSRACSARRRAINRRHSVSSAPSKIDSTRASTK